MLAKLRIGITAKLFAAIFSTCMLVLITMHWGCASALSTALSITLNAATSSG